MSDLLVWRRLHDHQSFPTTPGELGTKVIGHTPRGHVDQPATRILRHTLVRPLHGGSKQRLLDRVFRGGKVAEAPHDGAENLGRQLAQQVLARIVQRA